VSHTSHRNVHSILECALQVTTNKQTYFLDSDSDDDLTENIFFSNKKYTMVIIIIIIIIIIIMDKFV